MMSFTNPHFAAPHWLWLAGLGPASLVLLQLYAARMRQKQLAQLVAAPLLGDLTRSHSPRRRILKNTLLALAVCAFGLALARPRWGEQSTASVHLIGEDVVFLLDCSKSMLATDVSPHRLQRAQLAIRSFATRGGFGRLGLVVFGGQAFLMCPPTFDYESFDDAVMAVDDNTIPVTGSDIGRALEEGYQALGKNSGRKLLILISDGEDTDAQAVSTAKKLAAQGVVVFTIGVGTEAGAEIQVRNAQGELEPIRESDGQIHRSRLDEAALRTIAETTHGAYFPLGALGEGLAKARQAIEKSSGAESSTATQKFGVERFHYFIAAALVLLVLESLISTRRRTVAP